MEIKRLFKGTAPDVIRIPALACGKDGMLVALANLRVGGSEDHSEEQRIVYSVKLPDREWSPVKVAAEHPGWCFMLGSAVYDEGTGEILVHFKKIAVMLPEFHKPVTFEERDTLASAIEQRDGIAEGNYLLRFHPDGSFTEEPTVIEANPEVRGQFVIGKEGFSHGSSGGITVQNGIYKGRLIVPARMNLENMTDWDELSSKSSNTVIYSDDHGHHWQTGGIVEPGTGEGTLMERFDGSIYYNSRAYFKDGFRREAISFDGGTTFVQQRVQKDLIEPEGFGCNAAVVSFQYQGHSVSVFSNPRDLKKRKNMTLSISLDEGNTWPLHRLIDDRLAGYSAIAWSEQEQKLYVLYECGESQYHDELDIASLTTDLLVN